MDTVTAPIAGIGDNNPPSPVEILIEQLHETHAPLIERCNTLLAMGDRLPETMDDDWETKISDAIKSCTKFVRNSEVTRLAANEPHDALIAATNGFFKGLSDKVKALKEKMGTQYLTPYQQAKADAEKRKREALAAEAKRIADEEAAAARAEAKRLADIKRQEDEAKAEQERIARERRAAEEKAERDRQEAARQAAEATNKAERDAAAARQREIDEAAAADKKLRDAEAAKVKAEQDKLAADRLEQERISREQRDASTNAKQDLNKATEAAREKAADMSRSRSTLGSVSSLRTTWHFEVTNAAEVPRQYLEVDETAIRVAVRANTTKDGKNTLKIPGVRIYPKTDSVVT